MIILSFSLPQKMRVIGLLCVLLYGGKIFWQECVLKSKKSIVAISWNPNTGWCLYYRDHATDPVKLKKDSVLTRWVVILRFDRLDQSQTISCLVFYDALPVEAYRQLLIRMRC